MYTLQIRKPNYIAITDEWDRAEMIALVKKYGNLAVISKGAGGGKSTVCVDFAMSCGFTGKDDIMFVSPTTTLKFKVASENPTFNVETYDAFLGYTNGDIMTQAKKVKAKLIIFDEICMCSIKMIIKIGRFLKEHPNIICLCTGDCNQNKCVSFPYSEIKDHKKYRMDAVLRIFQNVLYLQEVKRQGGTPEMFPFCKIWQKVQHTSFLTDIFDMTKKPTDTVLKHFANNIVYTYDNLSEQNISYFKFRRQQIIRHVMQQKGKTTMFEVDDTIVVVNEFSVGQETKKAHIRFNKNNFYKILEINKTHVKIEHTYAETTFVLPIVLIKNFLLKYCGTGHSFQGDTLDGKDGILTVFDVNTPYVSREWIYTALTRIKDFDDMRIFWHSDESVERLEAGKLKQYLQLKVANYKRTDLDRFGPTATVTYEQCNAHLLNQPTCTGCTCELYFVCDNGEVESNFTLDRIDPSLPHTNDNVRCMCVDCNKALSNLQIF